MAQVRSTTKTGIAAALALAVSLPAAAQVATTRPLTMTLKPTALAPMRADPAQAPITPEQREQVADQIRHNPDVNLSTDKLSPDLRAWVKSEARATVDSGQAPDPNLIADKVRTRLSGQDYSGADIEAIAFLVMMEASKAAQDDLRDIMAQVKAQNERKAAMREAMQAQRAATGKDQVATGPELKAICVAPPCKPQLAAEVSRAADQKDSMSEMGEMQSMRLQMLMDRRSKFIETLSNLLKKQSETASTVTQNLK